MIKQAERMFEEWIDTAPILGASDSHVESHSPLVALIEAMNVTRARHIMTLESSLEYIFNIRRSDIRQREIPMRSRAW